MARGPAGGYVFAIRDPRIQGEKNIIFVGNGGQPWISIQQHLRQSSNQAMIEWARGLQKDFPNGVEVLGDIVCRAYHGEQVEVPPSPPGITRLIWEILDLETEPPETQGSQVIVPLGTRKIYWIKKLVSEGHPLLNKLPGRPRKDAVHEPAHQLPLPE